MEHDINGIFGCDVASNGDLVVIAFDNVIAYFSRDGTGIWGHANQGKAAWSDAIALGNGEAIAIIDMSLYTDAPNSRPLPDDRVVHIKKSDTPSRLAQVDLVEIALVPSGTKLYRNAAAVYAITPPLQGERRIMQLSF
jgi:hypothetical protein